jgi:hypothetical protein
MLKIETNNNKQLAAQPKENWLSKRTPGQVW